MLLNSLGDNMRYWKLSAYQIALLGIDTKEKELLHGELDTAYLSENNMVVCEFVGLTTRRNTVYETYALKSKGMQEVAAVIRTGIVVPPGVSDNLDEVLHGTRKATR